MCEPVTIAMAAVGAGVSIYSQVSKGQAEGQIAKNNVELINQQRAAGLQRGEEMSSAIKAQGARMGATALTQMGAGGIDPTSGSASALLAANTANAAADAERAKANAAMEAWGLASEAQDTATQGRINKRDSFLGATATGISAAGSAAGSIAKGLGQ